MSRKAAPRAIVKGRVARATRLDICGAPVPGEYAQVTTDGVISAEFTTVTTETEAIDVRNFAGVRKIYEPSIPEFAGHTVNLTFTEVDFDMFNIATGMPLVFDDAGNVVGIDQDTKVKLNDIGFALEIFAGVGSEDVCGPGEEPRYGYLLVPRLQGGVLGDFSITNGAISFTITGAQTRDGNQWGAGPYLVDRTAGEPSTLFQPLSPTAALRIMTVTVAPPTPEEGARPIVDVDLDSLTAVVAVAGATPQTAEFDTTPVSTGPVWYDFGDGTWDFVEAPGSTDHVYESAGTYTVRATQDGVWVSTTVTVPFP